MAGKSGKIHGSGLSFNNWRSDARGTVYGNGLCHFTHDDQRNVDLWCRNWIFNDNHQELRVVSRGRFLRNIDYEWTGTIDE